MVPLLPGRFSMKNCCLKAADSSVAISRPNWSALPPGAKATTILTGRLGHSCASGAVPGHRASMSAMTPPPIRRMPVLPSSCSRCATCRRLCSAPRIVEPSVERKLAHLRGRRTDDGGQTVRPQSSVVRRLFRSGGACQEGVAHRPFVPLPAGRAQAANGPLADTQQGADLALDAAVDRASGRRADEDEVLHDHLPRRILAVYRGGRMTTMQ